MSLAAVSSRNFALRLPAALPALPEAPASRAAPAAPPRRRLSVVFAPLAARAVWVHAARTCGAALLALYLAFQLELDTPYSAMTTVMIVANPGAGHDFAKEPLSLRRHARRRRWPRSR